MNSFEKLKTKLAELFQLDQADLDFGIYRIMNARRDEISRFLERDLLPQVREAFGKYKSSDKAEIQKKLDKVAEGVRAAGMDPEQSPKVKELREKYAADAVDITALENEVYDHLYSFFSRYYDEGDFISLRRYKEGVYAIPYEGEEVKLHWANHDQYYVKTTEYFRDYAFMTPSGHRVHFKIVEVDTEKDNVKAASGNDRRFLLHGDNPVAEEDGELVIRFEYRPDSEKRKQDAINADTARRVMADLNSERLSVWKQRLAVKWKRAGGKETDKTLLDKHLFDYTRRNTFDYFIHKDLGGFLRRELDFYIKNEVMRLDDIEEESVPRVEQYLSKIKVIRRIAHKIIDFLAQIENFQKKLWLKKKFVVETNYCVTLDRVPEEMYPEIAANDAQREEWVRLFAIDEIGKATENTESTEKKEKQSELFSVISVTSVAKYSEPLTVEFLKANPFLVLDTKFFPQPFNHKLLASFDNLEGKCGGVITHSENSQSLRLIQRRHGTGVDCIYIDPPFNTTATQILYKNDYRHSSWLSLVNERTHSATLLMKDDAIICVAIDDFELPVLARCLSNIFGEENHLATVLVRSNPHGRAMAAGFSTNHEYALFYAKTGRSVVGRLPRDERRNARYPESDEKGAFAWINFRKTGAGSARADRPKLYYPIFVSKGGKVRVPSMRWSETKREWEPLGEPTADETVVLPLDSEGGERVWNLGWERAQREADSILVAKTVSGGWQVHRKYHANQEGALPGTWWDDAKYSATESGTRVVKDILGGREIFSYPKSIYLVEDCLRASSCAQDSTVIDFFAGSGTTGHAVINLNREDGGNRKFILVEMGDYFDTVLVPRIKKVIYSKDWKDGKPVSREGISHLFKYIRLESYEDALANIELQRTGPQQLLLDKAGGFRESYMLKYLLDVESRGSQTLLNIDNFDDPWNYKLLVGAGSVGETKPVNVDLVETFNWLLGLKVKHIDRISGFQVVEGENPKGEKVLVIWRKVRELTAEGAESAEKTAGQREEANKRLDDFFQKQQYNTLDSEFDVIYVNGDNNLMNLPLDPDKEGVEPRYKVRLIEEEFKRLMFDVEDV